MGKVNLEDILLKKAEIKDLFIETTKHKRYLITDISFISFGNSPDEFDFISSENTNVLYVVCSKGSLQFSISEIRNIHFKIKSGSDSLYFASELGGAEGNE